jgi:uncharacterized protein YndB with AHSA1/START domain
MIEPLRMSFVVACEPDHAFTTWTRKASSWWPVEHTVSHEAGAEIVFEPHAGGRIFERVVDGREIEWGKILDWDPPHRLRYLWNIATDPDHATDVEIVFHELANSSTRVEIEHSGWERLGENGASWRDANRAGWDGVLPSYTACAATTRIRG